MFTTMTSENKETDNALKVWYVYEEKYFKGSSWVNAYHITRHVTKQYRYVGMDEASAKDGATTKVTQYTKTHKGWEFRPDDQEGPFVPKNYTAVVAEVVAQHTGGHMWSVEIQVNQLDDVWTTKLPSDLASAFDKITDSDYDE